MTDLEITRLCADAMGDLPHMIQHKGEWRFGFNANALGPAYNPLHDDAQAMALVKKFKVHQEWSEGRHGDHWQALCWDYSANRWTEIERNTDLNRAICECVAKMQAAK